jgi:hypothetical protein
VYVSDDYAGAIYRIAWDPATAAPGPVFVPPPAAGPHQAGSASSPAASAP